MHFLFADAMKENCDPRFMSFMGQTPILFPSLPSLFPETNVLEGHRDRIVPGISISEEIGAVRTYQGDPRVERRERPCTGSAGTFLPIPAPLLSSGEISPERGPLPAVLPIAIPGC